MNPPNRPTLDQLAAGPLDGTDAEILAATAQLFDALDPMPAGLIERITFGITLDALEAEVAELQRIGDPVGVRSAAEGEIQTVTFTSSTLSTMVTITPTSPDRARIDGWVAPGGGVRVELRVIDRSLDAIADGDGRFVFDDVPRGLVQFVLRAPTGDAKPVVTPSIEI